MINEKLKTIIIEISEVNDNIKLWLISLTRYEPLLQSHVGDRTGLCHHGEAFVPIVRQTGRV